MQGIRREVKRIRTMTILDNNDMLDYLFLFLALLFSSTRSSGTSAIATASSYAFAMVCAERLLLDGMAADVLRRSSSS